MQIVVCSDLHSDYARTKIVWPEADVAVIAGDVANTIGLTIKTLTRAAKIYPRIIYVPGNHEHYSNASQKRTVDETEARLRALMPQNVTMLGAHHPIETIDGVHFVGACGWYSADAAGDPDSNKMIWPFVDQGGINDDLNIGFRQMNQPMPWDRAKMDADLIRATLDGLTDNLPVVCVTHMLPHRAMADYEVADFQHNLRNAFYVNTHLESVLADHADRITMWINGHCHTRKEKMINGVYCVSNPRGYGMHDENSGWFPVVMDV